MNTKKSIILLIACLLLSAGGYAQIRYGGRAEMSINNPTFTEGKNKLEQPPAFMIGTGVENSIPKIDMSLESLFMIGGERVKFIYPDDPENNLDLTFRLLELSTMLKKKFSTGVPVKPYVGAGMYAKFYISERVYNALLSGEKETQAHESEVDSSVGILAGAGVEVANHVNIGINWRYVITGENARFIKDGTKQQKSLFTVSLGVFF